MSELSAIWIFPLKSARRIAVSQIEALPRGLALDRRWLLVDAEGKAITMRERPRMARIQVTIAQDTLRFDAPSMEPLQLDQQTHAGTTRTINIWKDTVQAHNVSAAADQWFSEVLGMPCHLVVMRPADQRLIESWPGVAAGEEVSFADGYPLLLISEASLQDLNSRLETPVTMDHFRPNLVVSGTEPYAEDQWQEIAIGDVHFKLVKPCARCVMTTMDPKTGDTITKGEPLRTLTRYRKTDLGVVFGQNLVVSKPGLIRVGQEIRIIK